jgi:hypothetical protein
VQACASPPERIEQHANRPLQLELVLLPELLPHPTTATNPAMSPNAVGFPSVI